MREKRRLVLDFDNTIVNTTKAFIDTYNLIYGRKYLDSTVNVPQWEKVHRYDFTDEIPTLTPYEKGLVFSSLKLYDFLEFYPNAKDIINRLSEDFEVEVVTMCSIDTVDRKYKFIKEHLPNCKVQPVLFPDFPDKSHINMEDAVFIDDHAKNLATSNAVYKICYMHQGITMDTNERWKGIVVTQWDDVFENSLRILLNNKI